MMDTVDVETEACAIGWSGDLEAVVVEWRQPAKGAEFQEALERHLEVIERRGARRLLSDSRALTDLSKSTAEWTSEDWLGRLAETDVTHAAVVYPEDRLGEHVLDQVVREHGVLEFEYVFVHDVETAVGWLRGK